MSDNIDRLGAKEKLQVLLSEYNSLRMEQVQRANSGYLIGGFIVTSVGILANVADFGIGYVISGIFVMTFLIFMFAVCFSDVQKANKRVLELEKLINDQFKEGLLVWQTHGGGIVGRFWRLIRGEAP